MGAVSAITAAMSDEVQREIALIYRQILEVGIVGPEDDIFSLGGDSLQAVRIALEIEQRFNVSIPVDVMEGSGRVREVAEWVKTQLVSQVGASE
jgi:acyl carrier protein